MRRAVLATGATVVGVAYLLNFKVASHLPVITPAPDPPAVAAQGSPSPPAPSAPSPTAAGVPDGTYTGPSVFVRFGDVQVRIVVAGGKVADVQATDLPTDRARSAEISQIAGPILRQEAIRAQSARINIVSGATYTSEGYAQSLEGALQQAHLG